MLAQAGMAGIDAGMAGIFNLINPITNPINRGFAELSETNPSLVFPLSFLFYLGPSFDRA